MKRHQWRMDAAGHQVCKRCGASRWGKPGGWGQAMLKGKPQKYCPVKVLGAQDEYGKQS